MAFSSSSSSSPSGYIGGSGYQGATAAQVRRPEVMDYTSRSSSMHTRDDAPITARFSPGDEVPGPEMRHHYHRIHAELSQIQELNPARIALMTADARSRANRHHDLRASIHAHAMETGALASELPVLPPHRERIDIPSQWAPGFVPSRADRWQGLNPTPQDPQVGEWGPVDELMAEQDYSIFEGHSDFDQGMNQDRSMFIEPVLDEEGAGYTDEDRLYTPSGPRRYRAGYAQEIGQRRAAARRRPYYSGIHK